MSRYVQVYGLQASYVLEILFSENESISFSPFFASIDPPHLNHSLNYAKDELFGSDLRVMRRLLTLQISLSFLEALDNKHLVST